MEEINAILGIDLEKATPEQAAKRANEVCDELADCYEEGTLEYISFAALSAAFRKVRGIQL